MKRIGFIGYGLRSETMMKSFRSLEADITVAAVARVGRTAGGR